MGEILLAIEEAIEETRRLAEETCGARDDMKQARPDVHGFACKKLELVLVDLPPLGGFSGISRGGGTPVFRDRDGRVEHVGGLPTTGPLNLYGGAQALIARCRDRKDPGA